MRLIIHLFIFILLSFTICAAQTDSAKTSSTGADAPATVYIYELHHARTLGRTAPHVYVDDTLLAALDGERYLIAQVPAGTHSFHSKNKRGGGVEIDLKPGETYYLRLELHEGVTIHGGHIVLVTPEEGRYDVKRMKPIKPADIRNTTLVVTNYPPSQ
jgi:hypothetical protein